MDRGCNKNDWIPCIYPNSKSEIMGYTLYTDYDAGGQFLLSDICFRMNGVVLNDNKSKRHGEGMENEEVGCEGESSWLLRCSRIYKDILQ